MQAIRVVQVLAPLEASRRTYFSPQEILYILLGITGLPQGRRRCRKGASQRTLGVSRDDSVVQC